MPEWELYLEWLVANGQNGVEWSLLSAKRFKVFDESDERLERLRTVAALAKNWSLRVGIDATFSQTQEHGFRLWRVQHDTAEGDWAEIRARVDWLLSAGFHYIASELGKEAAFDPNSPCPDP